MKVERARPCPTHTHTHAHTHTRWWGPRGLPGQVAGPWEWSWTQSPLCAGAPTGLSAVTVTTTQTSLRGASSPSNQAQARWPCPGLQPPYPTGVQWKAWLCLHLSSSQWLLSPCPCSGPQPCGMGYHVGCLLEGGACQEWRGIGLLDGLPVTLKTGREVCIQ